MSKTKEKAKGRIKNKKINLKTISIFLVIITCILMIIKTGTVADASNVYSKRYQPPSYNNEYYFSNKNIFYASGYGMPNCTAYAYGRAYELLNKKPNLCIENANRWFEYNKTNGYYSYGQKPKVGAIACWGSNGAGHVAVVEAITNDTIVFSNSGYNYYNFYLTSADVNDKNPGQSGWTFQGYIYIGNFKQVNNSNNDLYTVTASSGLNLRADPNTNGKLVATMPFGTGIIVTKTKNVKGTIWGYTNFNGENGWCSLEYTKFIINEENINEDLNLPTEEVITNMYGDLNGDGVVDILDATILQKGLVEVVNLSDSQRKYGDINKDGVLNIADVTEIQKTAVGLK